jgi:hypothetical protein
MGFCLLWRDSVLKQAVTASPLFFLIHRTQLRLYTYGLFSDTVSSSDYIVWNDTVINEFWRTWKELVLHWFKVYFSICLKGLGKITEKHSQDSWSLGGDLNLRAPEYRAGSRHSSVIHGDSMLNCLYSSCNVIKKLLGCKVHVTVDLEVLFNTLSAE